MNDSIYQEIENNPRFKELVQKRGRFAWLLSLITLALYVGFIFLIYVIRANGEFDRLTAEILREVKQ